MGRLREMGGEASPGCIEMFLICLTHDLEAFEHPFARPLGLAKGMIHPSTAGMAFRYLMGVRSAKKNPYDTFDRILEMESKYGARSTFFAIPSVSVASLNCIRRVRTSGSEVALHSVNQSYTSPLELWRQKRIIENLSESSVMGVRSHRLDIMIPRTFEFQKALGFAYDSSFFAPRYGQKRIYNPFFVIDQLVELPLAFMDSDFAEMTILGSNALHKVWERIERILDEYRTHEGVCTVLWHPHAFYDEGNEFHRLRYRHFKDFDKLYEMILEYGSKNSDKMCTCREVLQLHRPAEGSMW